MIRLGGVRGSIPGRRTADLVSNPRLSKALATKLKNSSFNFKLFWYEINFTYSKVNENRSLCVQPINRLWGTPPWRLPWKLLLEEYYSTVYSDWAFICLNVHFLSFFQYWFRKGPWTLLITGSGRHYTCGVLLCEPYKIPRLQGMTCTSLTILVIATYYDLSHCEAFTLNSHRFLTELLALESCFQIPIARVLSLM